MVLLDLALRKVRLLDQEHISLWSQRTFPLVDQYNQNIQYSHERDDLILYSHYVATIHIVCHHFQIMSEIWSSGQHPHTQLPTETLSSPLRGIAQRRSSALLWTRFYANMVKKIAWKKTTSLNDAHCYCHEIARLKLWLHHPVTTPSTILRRKPWILLTSNVSIWKNLSSTESDQVIDTLPLALTKHFPLL